jgi:putative transposase
MDHHRPIPTSLQVTSDISIRKFSQYMPTPVTTRAPQHLCLDKAFDTPACHQVAEEAGYTPHIRRIGEEKLDAGGAKTHPARRWVLERTLARLSRCRGILVRYEKKAYNYMSALSLTCALLWHRILHRSESAESQF